MKQLASLLACLVLTWCTCADERPNIVLIMADDLGYGDLSCYGSELVHTPHIDALARNGIRFTDYHSNGVVCSPTRAALLTGRYPQRTGVEGVITAARHREVGLPLEEITIAEVLKEAGYSTAMFGKWHLGYDIKKFGPQLQGFEIFEGFVSGNVDYFHKIDQEGHKDWYIGDELKHVDGYVTDLINDDAVDWIGEHVQENEGKPFFLYLAHGAPHYPLQGPDDEGFREVGKKIRVVPEDRRPIYKAMIESMDEGIGRVVAELDRQGLTENTLIVFTSDNGPSRFYGGSAGPLRGQKGTMYEGGHRVPMIMSGLEQFRGDTTIDCTTMSFDFFPTFAALAGADLAEDLQLDGLDLNEAVWFETSRKPYKTRELYWHMGDQWAARIGDYKAVQPRQGKVALYNLREDPDESDDLSRKHPNLVSDFIKSHANWLKETRRGVEPVSVQ